MRPVFETRYADDYERGHELLKEQGKGGGRPKAPFRADLVNAIKSEGPERYVNRRLKEYKAHLRRLHKRLVGAGVSCAQIEVTVVEAVKRAWHL